jgi:hypothetical protein
MEAWVNIPSGIAIRNNPFSKSGENRPFKSDIELMLI